MGDSTPDYYEILGVAKDADQSTIKSAYRKLAKTWHPDRVQEAQKEEATQKFKSINEAYAVLSDADKRRQYDNPAPEFGGFGRSRFFDDDFDPFKVFATIFGDDDDFFGMFGASRNRGMNRSASTRSRGARRRDRFDPFGGDPFGDDFFSGGFFNSGFGSFGSMGPSIGSRSFSSRSIGGRQGMGRQGSFRSVSKSTQIVNGRRRTIQTTSDNNGTTKEVFENGVLLEKWENGTKTFDMAIEGRSPADVPAIARSGSSRSTGSRSSHRSNSRRSSRYTR